MSETHYIEYKRSLNDSLEKEVVAFLNCSSGGKIIFGVNDDGSIQGLSNPDGDALKIKDRLRNKISPSILGLFDIKILSKESKQTIELTIASGPEKPYFINKMGMTPKGCYLRIGTAAEPMTQHLIDQKYARRTRNDLSKIRSSKQQLSFTQLKIYYSEKGKPLNDQFAHNLELLAEDGGYNYNAYLLSDINITSFKLAAYQTEDRSQLISSEEYGNTCIITATQKVLDRLDIENKTSSRIEGDRIDTRLWNHEALREAVRNAFVHNDYSSEIFPKFEIFSDRLEITTYGSLPSELTKEEFFKGYSSPRNKVLMRIFKDVGLVEQLGIGIPKILAHYDRSCFIFTDNFLRMQLPKSLEVQQGGTKIEKIVGYELLTPRQKDVLTLILENNKITYKELEEKLKITSSPLKKHLKSLKDVGAIVRKGTYSGTWIVNFERES